MATYDTGRRRAWLCIALDGPSGSGKRTNMQQLCHFFTTRWQIDMAGTRDEHEWLRVDGGVVSGLPILVRVCNLHGVEATCRRKILSDADAMLFVCDSTPDGVERAVLGVRRLSMELPPHVPIVVQANKQDAPNALDPRRIGRRLGLGCADARVVGARALVGEGVREALTTAIRLGVERIPADTLTAWSRT